MSSPQRNRTSRDSLPSPQSQSHARQDSYDPGYSSIGVTSPDLSLDPSLHNTQKMQLRNSGGSSSNTTTANMSEDAQRSGSDHNDDDAPRPRKRAKKNSANYPRERTAQAVRDRSYLELEAHLPEP